MRYQRTTYSASVCVMWSAPQIHIRAHAHINKPSVGCTQASKSVQPVLLWSAKHWKLCNTFSVRLQSTLDELNAYTSIWTIHECIYVSGWFATLSQFFFKFILIRCDREKHAPPLCNTNNTTTRKHDLSFMLNTANYFDRHHLRVKSTQIFRDVVCWWCNAPPPFDLPQWSWATCFNILFVCAVLALLMQSPTPLCEV